MSKPPATDSTLDNVFTRVVDPMVSRDGDNDVYNGNSVGAAARRDRLFGAAAKRKTNDPYLFAGMWSGAGSSILGADSKVSLSEDSGILKSVTDFVGDALSRTNLGATAAIFGITAALTAPDIIRDGKRVAGALTRGSADAATKVVAGEAAEAATKVVAGEAAEAATRVAAGEAAEASIRPAFRAAAEGIGTGGIRLVAKRIPLAGAFVTAGFAIHEAHGFWERGETGKAVAAGFVGAAETIGNFFTFGLAGDVFREAARGITVFVGGEEYEDIARSDVVAMGQAGAELYRNRGELVAHFTEAVSPSQTEVAYAPVASAFRPNAATFG